ncbi:hypothetical protein EON65_15330 [archaeon]|nr:MAG: hypothetical protein EON65_15330 [archaeon]
MNDQDAIAVLQLFGALSVVLSAIIILTFVCFRSMRNKIFMKIIAFIAISNFLSDLPYISGRRPSHGGWCWLQSFLTMTFYPASWMWTATVAFFLYAIATKGVVPEDIRYLHWLNWGLPIVLALFMLPITPYGRSDYTEDFEVCNFEHSNNSVAIYHYITFYGLLVACFASMIYWKHTLHFLEKQEQLGQYKQTFEIAKTSLSYFPKALALCWIPRLIAVIVTTVEGRSAETTAHRFALVSIILKIFYGIACAFIFFRQSAEARTLWLQFFGCIRRHNKDVDGGDDTDVRPSEETFSVMMFPPLADHGPKSEQAIEMEAI